MEALAWFTPIRWVAGIGREVASLWHHIKKSPQSQDQSKIKVKRSFFFINFLNFSLLEIGLATTQESSSAKTLFASSIQENIDTKKGQSLKDKKISASGQKAKKEFKDDIVSLEKAAKKGNAEAQRELGYAYYEGKRIEKNLKKAFDLWHILAKQGNINAQFNLGVMYEKGEGIEQDYKKAFHWYSKAAEQGFVIAQFNLGNMYRKGEGVEKNLKEAFSWLHKAAEKGDADAQFNLGVSYYFGRGVLENYQQASIWWRKATEQGDSTAQYNLGCMYYVGIGVEKNLPMAYGLLLLAKQGGEEKTKNMLPKIKPTLTTEQITEGQKIAQEWQAKIDANKNKEE